MLHFLACLFILLELCTGDRLCDDMSCFFGAECQFISPSESSCVCPDLPCDLNTGIPEVEICGDDGVTYRSYCELQKHQCINQRTIQIQDVGPCEDSGRCTSKYDCMTDGECLNGKCICIECRDVSSRKVYYNDQLRDDPYASLAFKRSSVCGTDDVTYESACHLKYAACVSKASIEVFKRGICRHDRRAAASSPRFISNVELADMRVSPRSTSRPLLNCSVVKFDHCVSQRHPRLYYMGQYENTNRIHLGAPIYKLQLPGSVDQLKRRKLMKYSVYLSRYKSTRRRNGGWLVGSKVGSKKGWLGVSDNALHPENVNSTWKSTLKTSLRSWKTEPTLKLRCIQANEEPDNCAEGFSLEFPPRSNWRRSALRSPIYSLRLFRLTKTRKYRPGKKFALQISTSLKTMRFVAFLIKISTDREHCGIPSLVQSKKTKIRRIQHCGGKVVLIGDRSKKMMKHKIRFKAPLNGCIWFRVAVLSARGFLYEDDNLVQKICSKKP